MIAIEREDVRLYKLNQLSFLLSEIENCLLHAVSLMPVLHTFVNTMSSKTSINKEGLSTAFPVCMHVTDIIDLHERLGHASFNKLKYIKGFQTTQTIILNALFVLKQNKLECPSLLALSLLNNLLI